MVKEPKEKLSESLSNLGLYIAAIIILVLAEVVAVLAINFYRPEKDNTIIMAPVTMLIVSIVTSLLNLINGHQTRTKAVEASEKADAAHKLGEETGKAVNGRMEKLLEEAKLAAYLKGKQEAKDEAVREMGLLMATPPVTPAPVVVAPVVPPTASVDLTKSQNG